MGRSELKKMVWIVLKQVKIDESEIQMSGSRWEWIGVGGSTV